MLRPREDQGTVDRLPPHIGAVELQQVEGVEKALVSFCRRRSI